MHSKSKITHILLAATLLFTFGCGDLVTETPVSVVQITDSDLTVELSKNQICTYLCTGGEDGAIIKTQAEHFEVSEIKRNSNTDYNAIYSYKPKVNYVGYDFVEIEILPDVIPIDEPSISRKVKIEFFIK
ncbi:MAG: hypothetical protein KKF62_06590 [Bacteroidetes bacterium]|nr:hypothetical protein [Bacteroidota bacterium]MBU1113916.1 hypothetical protein [Bacteroidota bacterium]MBU1798235.1 hypothetical protein [Bacteroidota bacterium]